MTRRRRQRIALEDRYPKGWTIHEEWRGDGHHPLTRGREFTVRRSPTLSGRLVFRHAVTTAQGDEWIEATDADGRYRSLDPDRVRTVHRDHKVTEKRRRAAA